MTKPQRFILTAYCLLLAYCFVWIPWHTTQPMENIRLGYGWLWVGPPESVPLSNLAAPDVPLVVLRLLAITVIAAAAIVATWPNRKPKP